MKTLKSISLYFLTFTIILNNIHSNELSTENKSNKIIHLIGENHGDLKCMEYKKLLSDQALNQDIILALEGAYFSPEYNSHFFGIEDKDIYNLSYALEFYYAFSLYKIADDISTLPELKNYSSEINSTIKLPATNAYLSSPLKALENMFINFKSILSPDTTDILEKISSNNTNKQILKKLGKLYLLRSKQPNDYQEIINQFEKNHSYQSPFFSDIDNNISNWINFFRDLAEQYYNKAYDKGQLTPSITNNFINLTTKIQYYLEIRNFLEINPQRQWDAILDIQKYFYEFQDFRNEIILTSRNNIFLKNIINIYENTEYQQHEFYVIIGSSHAPFLYEELTKLGYQVNLNSWAQDAYTEHFKTQSAQKKEL